MSDNRSSYVLAVVADLAYVFGFRDLYEDLVNDLEAVGAVASLVIDRAVDEAELIARVHYSLDEEPPAEHHTVPASVMPAGAAGSWFDCLARWATLRDRHSPSVLRQIVFPDGSA